MKPVPTNQPIEYSLAYHRLSVVQQLFECSIDELDQQQRERVETVVARKYELEHKVLSSDQAMGLSVPETEIQKALQEIQQRYEQPEEFSAALAQHGLNDDTFVEALTRELWVDAVLDRVGGEVAEVDDTDIELYYYMHPKQFEKPETRIARHILITINEQLDGSRREQALEKITAIARRLQKKINRFQEQAAKHSECPTALNGGLLGEIKPGLLYPQLDQVLFQLSEGQLSPVVESELGWHLLLCEKIHSAGVMPLSQVADTLRNHLTEQRRKVHQKQWLVSLRN
ncbi:nitrogen fixation protein NifM [Gynuella sp.]|uniref:nitrogen fixation protein NifM n=1 Tax=Gynuella sp. TaxID=2969146 RepID=UPI003D0C26D3